MNADTHPVLGVFASDHGPGDDDAGRARRALDQAQPDERRHGRRGGAQQGRDGVQGDADQEGPPPSLLFA